MKIAHLSDLHFDERGHLQDVVDTLEAFLGQAHDAEVDLILLAGDCFERRSTATERNAMSDFLRQAAEVAPVFGVKGNHDAPGDLYIFNFLKTHHRVEFREAPAGIQPGTAVVFSVGPPGISPSTIAPLRWSGTIDRTPKPRVGILALPWFDKAHVVAMSNVEARPEVTKDATIAAARDVLECLRTEALGLREKGIIPILVAHVMVGGSVVSSGQTLIGTSVELSPADIMAVGAEYAALGHVHKTQEWYGGRVCYSGSPHRCNLGEPEAKGWRLVTFDDEGRFKSNEFMELPARKIVLLERDWTHDIGQGDGIATAYEISLLPGARVRWRVRIRAEDLPRLDSGLVLRFLESKGAVDVKIETIVESEVRARVPDIVTTESVGDKVMAYLKAKEVPVDEAKEDRLRTKVSALEQP